MAASQLNDPSPVSDAAAAQLRRMLDEEPPRRRTAIISVLLTLAALAIAAPLSWEMWRVYVDGTWTRDGTIRAYVDRLAPEVAGRIVALPVQDNQYVHRGDLLMQIDPTDYQIAVKLAAAVVQQDQAALASLTNQAARRRNLRLPGDDAASRAGEASLQQAQARLEQAQIDLARTQIRAPADGWVTNLQAQPGDYANVGVPQLALVDAGSFWVDGYFRETNLRAIHVGDPAKVKLLGYGQVLSGHVASITRAIGAPGAQPNPQGLVMVNPIFTWVRLAQRVPVRIRLDHLLPGIAAGGRHERDGGDRAGAARLTRLWQQGRRQQGFLLSDFMHLQECCRVRTKSGNAKCCKPCAIVIDTAEALQLGHASVDRNPKTAQNSDSGPQFHGIDRRPRGAARTLACGIGRAYEPLRRIFRGPADHRQPGVGR